LLISSFFLSYFRKKLKCSYLETELTISNVRDKIIKKVVNDEVPQNVDKMF